MQDGQWLTNELPSVYDKEQIIKGVCQDTLKRYHIMIPIKMSSDPKPAFYRNTCCNLDTQGQKILRIAMAMSPSKKPQSLALSHPPVWPGVRLMLSLSKTQRAISTLNEEV